MHPYPPAPGHIYNTSSRTYTEHRCPELASDRQQCQDRKAMSRPRT